MLDMKNELFLSEQQKNNHFNYNNNKSREVILFQASEKILRNITILRYPAVIAVTFLYKY